MYKETRGKVVIMTLDPTSSLKEIKSILSRRTYYESARVMLALVRADGQLKPVGGYAILSDKPTEETHALDYGTLLLLETSLTREAFDEWLTKLVREGTASLAGFEIVAKGDFEPVTWPYERFMPSDYEYFPVEWGCDFYKFKFQSQASIPGPLPVKPELPLYPDGQTAWGQWMKIEPTRIDLPGKFFFLFPNMESKIDQVVLTSKSIRISLLQGKEDFSSLKGKKVQAETIRRKETAELRLASTTAIVLIHIRRQFFEEFDHTQPRFSRGLRSHFPIKAHLSEYVSCKAVGVSL